MNSRREEKEKNLDTGWSLYYYYTARKRMDR